MLISDQVMILHYCPKGRKGLENKSKVHSLLRKIQRESKNNTAFKKFYHTVWMTIEHLSYVNFASCNLILITERLPYGQAHRVCVCMPVMVCVCVNGGVLLSEVLKQQTIIGLKIQVNY